MNIGFESNSGHKKIIATPVDIKVKDLLLAFAEEVNIDKRNLGKNIFFLFNGSKININEEKNIKEYGLRDFSIITVLDFLIY